MIEPTPPSDSRPSIDEILRQYKAMAAEVNEIRRKMDELLQELIARDAEVEQAAENFRRRN